MLNWVLVLGGCGLVAGIWGPIRFNPQFQMGPLIGVFITGPLGAILGLVGYFVSRWLDWPMSTQWRAIAAVGTLLVAGTILSSFPGPEFKAFIVNGVVERCRPVSDLRDELIVEWQTRVDNIKSTEPAPGWQQAMTSTIESASGIVVNTRITHRSEIRVQRKPWNRGTLIAIDRTKADDHVVFLDETAGASCANYASGKLLESFVDFVTSRPVRDSNDWPPTEISRIITHLELKPVPPEYQQFRQAYPRQ